METLDMYPHRIRLRGPWDCEPLPRPDEPPPPPRRVNVPCSWDDTGLGDFRGRVRFRRRFGYPGRIDAHERVWLVLEEVACRAEVRLNDRLLDNASSSFEQDVTSLLQARNELLIDVEPIAERGPLWSESALEVRCTAFLRRVQRIAVREGDGLQLHVRGEVVGHAERPLELYVVIGRSPAGYQVVTADPRGRPFEVIVPNLPEHSGEKPIVKVDLVNGASVWYTSEDEWVFAPKTREDG